MTYLNVRAKFTNLDMRLHSTKKWELLDDFTYGGITVPKGFMTDLASIPRFLWSFLPPHGKYAKAAVIHDYLYENAIGSKKYADDILLQAMEDLDVKKNRRVVIYYAVRLFGRGKY